MTVGGPKRDLPHDPDIEVDEGPAGQALPVHLTPKLVLLVFIGGTLGVLLRAAVVENFATQSVFPWATFAVNIAGALALSVLIEALAVRGFDVGHRRNARLLFGTGVLGGFTTYSALAVETDGLLRAGALDLAFAYAVGTVAVGFVASIVGITMTRRVLTP